MDAIAQTHISCYEQVVDNKLMNELKTIKNILSPDEVLLVVDSMTGQEAANLTK